MKMVSLCAAILIALGSVQAHAENFAGAGLGLAFYPNNIDYLTNTATTAVAIANPGITIRGSGTQKSSVAAIKLFGGTWINDNLGFEVGYADLGKSTATVTTTGVATSWTFDVASTAFYGAALIRQKLTEVHSVQGKVGVYSANTKVSASVIGPGGIASINKSATNTGILLGLGYVYKFSPILSLRAELEHFNGVGNDATIGKGNINLLTANIVYGF